MKKYNLLKAIGITFLIVVVMSWLIPAGAYSSGTYTALGKTAPLGLADLSRAPMVGITQLAVIGVIFLAIGGLYGVLNKTGAYTSIVEKLVEKVKNKKIGFLVFTIILFTVLSSLTGSAYVLFTLVPFFVTVILLLNYNKMIAFTTTVGAILVGRIGSTYGSTVSNYLNGYFSLDANNQIIVKFILLAILTALLVFFVIKTAKDNTDKKVEMAKKVEEKVSKKVAKTTKTTKTKKSSVVEEVVKVKHEVLKDIPLYNGTKGKRNTLPLIVVCGLFLVFMLIGTFDWSGTFNISLFTDLHSKIASLEILGYPLFGNLLGYTTALGQWSSYDIAICLLFIPAIIVFIYGIKFEEAIDAYLDGVKRMLPVAGIALVATCVFVAVVSTSTGSNIFATIENWLLGLSKGFNLATTSLLSMVSGFFYNDFQYAVYNVAQPIQKVVTDTTLYPLVAILLQTLYGLVMMIVPTSIFLVAGLAYLNISYKEWFKYIWKYLLAIFITLVVIFIVIAILI